MNTTVNILHMKSQAIYERIDCMLVSTAHKAGSAQKQKFQIRTERVAANGQISAITV